MIWNIIDRRKRCYRWKRVNAIIEAVEHDNSRDDSDQASDADVSSVIDYDQLDAVSVPEAVSWAQSKQSSVTLYLYDDGDGISSDEDEGKESQYFKESSGRF